MEGELFWRQNKIKGSSSLKINCLPLQFSFFFFFFFFLFCTEGSIRNVMAKQNQVMCKVKFIESCYMFSA